MPHEVIENRTLTFTGNESFYGDSFLNCRLVRKEHGRPEFFNCVFVDCEFDPPLPEDGRGSWFSGMWGAMINP